MEQLSIKMTTQESTAWQKAHKEGFNAKSSDSTSQNPYKYGTIEHAAWKRGWNVAAMAKRVMR